jgi:hypothetical protein
MYDKIDLQSAKYFLLLYVLFLLSMLRGKYENMTLLKVEQKE